MDDATTKNIENLRILARRARHEQGNDKSAIDYYEKILLEDPNDWEAYFFSNTFKIVEAMLNHEMEEYEFDEYEAKLYHTREELGRLKDVLKVTLQLLSENRSEPHCESELSEICIELERITALSTTSTSVMMAACDVAGMPELFSTAGDMFVDLVFGRSTETVFLFAEDAINTFDNEAVAAKALNINKTLADTLRGAVYYRDLDSSTKSILKKVNKEIENRVQPLVRKRVDEYWEQHADEKQKLLTEKAELQEKANQLKAKIDKEKDSKYKQDNRSVKEMKNNLLMLDARYNNLGFFKKKEKEALQKQINETRRRIQMTEAVVAKKDDVIEPLQKRYDDICNKIIKIEAHFSKIERKETEAFLSQGEEG